MLTMTRAGIEELASIRKLYVQLATESLVEAVALAVQAQFEQDRIQLKRVELELARHEAVPGADVQKALELSRQVALKRWETEDR